MLTWSFKLPEEEHSGGDIQIYQISLNDTTSQYVDLGFYLKKGYAPMQLSYKNKRALRLKAKQYQMVDDVLFRKKLWFYFTKMPWKI